MHAFLLPTSVGLLAFAATAQNPTSSDVGLTMGGGTANVVLGQICGPVPCQPLPSGTIARGATYFVTQNAAAFTPFAIAIGMPVSVCVPVSGVANGLLLGSPFAVFAVGVTGPPVPANFCPRGVATVQFAVPGAAPVGFAVHLQSLGVDWSGQLAFSPAIAAVTQ